MNRLIAYVVVIVVVLLPRISFAGLGVVELVVPPQKYGIFIAIDEYPEEILTLYNCKRDADVVSGALGCDEFEITKIYDEEATYGNIMRALEDRLNSCHEGDLLVLFFASHGVLQYDDFFVLPYSDGYEAGVGSASIMHSAISGSLIMDFVSYFVKKDVNVILFFDTCYSAGMSFDISNFYNPGSESGCALIVSASPLEAATDSSQDTFSLLFSQGLLGEADFNSDKEVTIREAFDYAYEHVRERSDGMQHPVFISTLPNTLVLKSLGEKEEQGMEPQRVR
ncbi:MAG: hypothetical protein D6E12_01340 [Desulfovibrio sp.]|nr:MAG: hypothetical protein D6E12_01340 [Desulfovibrio sp.]